MSSHVPYAVTRFQETPNPNALKCVLDASVPDAPRSYFNAKDAAADPLAARLFAIPNVTNILIGGEWITVSKSPQGDWRSIKKDVERALREA
jgi:hypothetical protein